MFTPQKTKDDAKVITLKPQLRKCKLHVATQLQVQIKDHVKLGKFYLSKIISKAVLGIKWHASLHH